ncbi:hypothetical protein CPC08DRAFT_816232 [Agrocybe pediades]|nr:hypothetical protein CPC08DRAFT_816232 [Agrocybe pediades]
MPFLNSPTLYRSSGYNGADAELGPGLYATDHVETAMFFANTAANARKLKDKAVKPMVCGVEAIESEPWRTQVPKIWIPHDKVAKLVKGHNNPALLKDQESLITHAGFKVADTVRFSPLDIDNLAAGKPVVSGNQFSLPTTQFPKVYIRSCIDITGQTAAQVLAHFKQLGWPDRDFSSAQFRTDWHIHA